MANRELEKVFRQLGRTEKTRFINENIDYASEEAVAGYVERYPLGVFEYLPSTSLMARILKMRGFQVIEPDYSTASD